MLQLIYRLFAAKFRQFVINDFVNEIPDSVRNPGLQILKQYRPKVEKLAYYQAYSLHARMLSDPKHSEMYMGMLLQLKLLLSMMGEQREEGKPEEPIQEEDSQFKTAIEGLGKFFEAIKKQ